MYGRNTAQTRSTHIAVSYHMKQDISYESYKISLSIKYAKFLASETCDKQQKNHDNLCKFSKFSLREIFTKRILTIFYFSSQFLGYTAGF